MENNLNFLQLSSLHKVFLNEDLTNLKEETGIVALKGERVSYQILYSGGTDRRTVASYSVKKDERLNVKVRKVGNVPCELPARRYECDDYYLRIEPGLYPDVLYPIGEDDIFHIILGNAHSLYITVEIPEDIEAGVYDILVSIDAEGVKVTKKFEIKVLNAVLPKQYLTYTQWFHPDCIASYYGFEPLSEEHWDMMEKFVKMAAYTGINLILTPIYTLPLDTEVGRERPTVQLVDIEYKNGEYKFGFEKLGRWIKMCKKYGIESFEMPHLFSQWGTGCTPKIVAHTEEGEKKIFGWHVKADTKEYRTFLNCFIPELTAFLKEQGVYDNTYFHISDEPNYEKHYEIYKLEREMVADLIPSEKIMDAMSHFEFCEAGIIEKPIPITSSVEKFIEKGYELEWTYYCCGPCNNGYSNRLIAMPSGRTRIVGIQMYKYNLTKFLHWGYNFYYTELSKRAINPFLVTDAEEGFQSGDSYSVYPGEDGPLESLRSVVFFEGIQDMRACKLLESYIGREEVVKLLEEECEIKFNQYPRTDSGVMGLREKINKKLEEVLK